MKTNTALFIKETEQQTEVVVASIQLDVPTEELRLIPLITGDFLDNEELVMIYGQYLSYVKECDYLQQEELSLKDWLIDTQFEGKSRAEGVAERKRLEGLGFKL